MKYILTFFLLIIIPNLITSSNFESRFDDIFKQEFIPDTTVVTDTFHTCEVADTIMVEKMYNCIKKTILKKDSSDWFEPLCLGLYFVRISDSEYQITVDASRAEGIYKHYANSTIWRYKYRTFLLKGDIPPYFKVWPNSITITSVHIFTLGKAPERAYSFMYKDGEFYHCNGKFEILPD